MSSNSSNQTPEAPQQEVAPVQATHIAGAAPSDALKPKPRFWKSTGLSLAFLGWTFAGFMLAQVIVYVVLLAIREAGVDFDGINTIVFNTVANMIVYTAALAAIVGLPWLILKKKTSMQELGLSRLPHWKDFLWLLAGIVAYLVLTVTITLVSRLLFPGADYDQAQETGFANLNSQFEYILTFISLVVVAPIAEEVMFRGYLFGKLKKYAKVWISVILSALLFGIVHFQFNVALDTFALGVVLALLRVATGSVWASIMLHMAKNGLAFYFLFISTLPL